VPSYPARILTSHVRILTSQKAHACCCFYVVKTKEALAYCSLKYLILTSLVLSLKKKQ
jgi:hypothetical protein